MGEERCTDSCPRILSVPRSEQLPDSEARGQLWASRTDHVQGQLFVHISEAKSSLLSLSSSSSPFIIKAKAAARNKTMKTKLKAKHVDSLVLYGTAFSTSFQVSSSVNWRKTLHFEVCSPDGGHWLWAGIIGWERPLTSGRYWVSRVTVPPITRERKLVDIREHSGGPWYMDGWITWISTIYGCLYSLLSWHRSIHLLVTSCEVLRHILPRQRLRFCIQPARPVKSGRHYVRISGCVCYPTWHRE